MSVRTRFAPSPTGHVHIGNIRAAIFNWLFARHEGGSFLLRIEDTDRERSTPEAVKAVLDALEWLGLNVDEPALYQSTRTQAHREAAGQLLGEGLAYKTDKGGTGKGEAIVFRMPGTDMAFHDEIKGDLQKKAEDMKDFVIVRSDGSPVFHLANVVDDIDMGITHIIRGDDHVENTFRHVALFRALGAPVPKYAHLPMIVNAQGKPYSKRDGAAFVGDFREKGFLPEALFNSLALLGWSPGGDLELMTRKEMAERFTLDRVQSSPAQMDFQKLLWMNGQYMMKLPEDVFRAEIRKSLQASRISLANVPDDYVNRVFALMKDRVKLFPDASAQMEYFFTEHYPFDDKAVQKRLKKEGAIDRLRTLRERFATLDPWTAESTEALVRSLGGDNASEWVHPTRAAVSGSQAGPGLFQMLEVLGRERVVSRIDRAVAKFA